MIGLDVKYFKILPLLGQLLTVIVSPGYCKSYQLGKILTATKIVGGSLSTVGSKPYLVAITVGPADGLKSFICGASLLTRSSVLTAAHCTAAVSHKSELISSLRVTVGSNLWKTGGTSYEVSHNVTHPQFFMNDTPKNDLSFMYTTMEVELTKLVQPLALDFNYVNPGDIVTVAGWGKTEVNNTIPSDFLIELTQTILDNETCIQRANDLNYPDPNWHIDYNIEICTLLKGHHGTCNGDSGSPLVRTDDDMAVRGIGCVSWGFPCGLGGPDMFVRFSAFQDWIQQNLHPSDSM